MHMYLYLDLQYVHVISEVSHFTFWSQEGIHYTVSTQIFGKYEVYTYYLFRFNVLKVLWGKYGKWLIRTGD